MTTTNQQPEDRLRQKIASLDIEFLHGVPVSLPASGIDAIMQVVKDEIGAAEELGRLEGVRATYMNYASLAPDELPDRIAGMDKAIAELRNHFGIGGF